MAGVLWTGPARAQDERPIWLQFGVGTGRVYLDEYRATGLGGGFLVPVTRRLKAGGEVYYAHGDRFHTLFLQPLLRVEDPKGAVTPYLVAAGGVALQDDLAIDYRSHEFTLQGGAGMQVKVTDRVAVAPEIRLGFGALPRFTVLVEFALP
jgi:hypothetical protein